MLNSIVEGKYRVKKLLGSGAQATVYLVEEVDSHQERAMKVLSLDFRDNPLMVKRFRREFLACSRLSHPSIIKLYHFGRLPDGMYYYTMDLLPFDDLETVLDEHAPFSEARTETIIRRLLSAMDCYHRASVVHRDLKPANIILAPDDQPVIVDFGLVRDLTKTPMTKTGTAMGTPYFMSPEVLQGLPADHRADIYALGVIAYQMLVGDVPFTGDELGSLFNEILVTKPKAPSTHRPNVSPLWDGVILKCLEKDPDLRFGSCADILASLDGTEVSSSGERKDTGKSEAIDDSVVVEKERVNPLLALPFLLFLSIVVALCWYWRSPEVVNYSVRNFTTISKPNALLVTWESDEAYPSEIIELESGQRFKGQQGKAVREHRLLLSPLAGGKNVSFKICFPNDKSSMKKTGLVGIAGLSQLQAHRQKDVLSLSWNHEYGREARLVFDGGSRKCTIEKGRWNVELNEETLQSEKLEVHFFFENGRKVRVDVIPFIRKSILSTKDALAQLDEEQLLSKLSVQMGRALSRKVGAEVSAIELTSQKYREDVRKLHGEILAQLVKEEGLLSSYTSLVAWSPLIFESKALRFSFNERHLLVERLNKMITLSLYSYTRKAEPRFHLASLPVLGDFALTSFNDEPVNGQIVFDKRESPEGLTPPHFGFDLAKRSHHFSALLSDRYNLASVALHLRLRSFRNFLLQLRVNDKLNLYIYDEPYLTYREKEFITLVQQLPLEVLKEGENKFELAAVQIYDGAARNSTDLALVRLVTRKKGRQ